MSAARERPSWWLLAAIALVALAARMWCVAQYEREHPLADRPAIDEASYDAWAREIAGGDVLGREIFFQEPLYPYVLGGVYALAGEDASEQRKLARRVQAGLGALTAVLVALLGARMFGARAGALAGLGLALYLPAIWFAALLLKPSLFLPLLALFLLRLVDAERTRDWLVVGALAGLGALLRGNMLVLTPLVALWPAGRAALAREFDRRALAGGAAVAVGVALVLMPVALRNHHVGGRFVLTTSGAGTNFYGGNNLDNPYGVATEFDWVRGVPEHEAADWRHEASRRAGRELDPTQTSSFWRDAALESMARAPLEHVRILGRKLRLALNSYETPDNHFLDWDARYVPFLRAPLPGFGVLGLLGLCGLALCLLDALRRRLYGRTLEVAAFFALYLGTIVLTVMSDRVRLALLVPLAPFAAWFVLELKRWRVAPHSMLAATPGFALAAWFVFAPVFPPERYAADLDERDHNLAVELLKEGRLDECAPLIDGLEQRRPGAARVTLLAAELDYRRARAELDATPRGSAPSAQAAQLIRSALERLESVELRGAAQERFRASALAGAVHQYFGRWNDAEARYRSALAFDPSDRDLRRRLAVVIAEQAMLSNDRDVRTTRLAESIAILEALLAEREEPELADLLSRARAAAR